jgi:hypothetical protein
MPSTRVSRPNNTAMVCYNDRDKGTSHRVPPANAARKGPAMMTVSIGEVLAMRCSGMEELMSGSYSSTIALRM